MNRHAVTVVILFAAVSIAVAWFRVGIGGRTVQGNPQSVGGMVAGPVSSQIIDSEAQIDNGRERRFRTETRPPWTTSRLTGTPEPPPKYRTERAWPKIKFKNPTVITSAPGTDRLFVAEQASKLYSIPNDADCEQADLFFDLARDIRTHDPAGPAKGVGDCYGLAFHPQFETNRSCYICYVLNGKKPDEPLPDGTRVSRFRVTETDPPRVDPGSEEIIITWLAGGHNGGCLAFGPDGCLYISSGDATPPSPPDGLDAGQDMSRLLSGILRIDVDHREGDRPYSIPADNPFTSLAGARPEKWAYGFRNPWKFSFDRATGDLWCGDVGWELWELVYRVERGGNYGWSIMEGPQPVKVEGKRGPTPILPPTIALPHSEAASVTGGYVYRGTKLDDLVGAYVFGDWETRRIWAAWWDGAKIARREDLVEPTLRVVAFAEERNGELLVADYDDGTIHRLVPNDAAKSSEEFPRKLSETGLFESTPKLRPAAGVLPFEINAAQWSDGTRAERLVGLPGDSSIKLHANSVPIPGTIMQTKLEWPKNAVLAKTVSLEFEQGKPETSRRVETQVLHFSGNIWRAYSYRWNDTQTDAELVEAGGADSTYSVIDPAAPGGTRQLAYDFAGRTSCLRCHNPWAQHTLAFNVPQLDRDCDFGDGPENQLRVLGQLGVLVTAAGDRSVGDVAAASGPMPHVEHRPRQLVDPYDESAELDQRARSYLQVNCSHCHQPGAGGSTEIDLRFTVPDSETKATGVRPMQGTFGIHDAHIVSPGDPYRSVLYYRISKLGGGRMPHIGSSVVDQRGANLIHDWIRSLPVRTRDANIVEKLRGLDEAVALAREAADVDAEVDRLANEIAKSARRDGPSEQDRASAAARSKRQSDQRAAQRAKDRSAAIAQLLGNTSSALMVARAIDARELSEPLREQVIAAATAHADVQIRDLFEKFVPDEKRTRRLGSVVQPEKLLALAGDAARGRELFLSTAGVQCKNCHKIGDAGSTLGPELTRIGAKYSKAQILESILEPSKFIDPKYVMHLVETKPGRVLTGLVAEKSSDAIVLRNALDESIRIAASDIEQFVPQRQSIMPELLLRDMTADQVADLLAFLAGLK